MSKVGKKPIIIPDSVEAKISDGFLEFKGKNGGASLKILPYIKAEIKDKSISFVPENNSKQARANWGTIRSLAYNAIVGLTEGFSKVLEIEGVGYRVSMEGDTLVLNVGLSHPIKFISPKGIEISVQKNIIKVSGSDKGLVGQTSAKIRSFRKIEPYKGKGIKYQGEIARRKAGKKVVGTTK
jgi:large subunit ribosomal protein L6